MQTLQIRQVGAPHTLAPASGWTKPFLGIQHLGTGDRWATLKNHGSFAELTCWFPGCGFRPDTTSHTDAEKARQAGEAWFGLFGHA